MANFNRAAFLSLRSPFPSSHPQHSSSFALPLCLLQFPLPSPLSGPRISPYICCSHGYRWNVFISGRNVLALTTIASHLQNIIWGQSLHFVLEKKTSKYLNVSVHSRCALKKTSHADEFPSVPHKESTKPAVLGYVSPLLKYFFCLICF